MRKQSVFLVLALGCVLASYQNCSGGMQAADQEFQNLVETDKQKNPEPDIDLLVAEKGKAADKAAAAAAAAAAAGQPAASAPPAPSCLSTDSRFIWPMGGKMYADSVIIQYVDHDSSSGLLDYKGNVGNKALTYDGHKGVDIAVASFRAMDANLPVYAAAAGTVINVEESFEDRHVACENDNWNIVTIRHANGFKSSYGHLKRNSVPVVIGQQVAQGQVIGVVGSSGCSTTPHLHFQVHNCDNKTVDPMKGQQFMSETPVYTNHAPTTIMEMVAKQPMITSLAQMKDPGANTSQFKADQTFSLGHTLAAAKAGDVIRLEFIEPSGAKSSLYIEHRITSKYTLSRWWWNIYLHQTGIWKAQFKVNGVLQTQQNLNIVP